MADLTLEDLKEIHITHDTVIEIKTVLLGKNGDTGLVGRVEQVCEGHARLSRNFWILVASLVGSGVLGVSFFELLK